MVQRRPRPEPMPVNKILAAFALAVLPLSAYGQNGIPDPTINAARPFVGDAIVNQALAMADPGTVDPNLFAHMGAAWGNVLQTATTSVQTNILQANAQLLTTILVLYVMLVGTALMFHGLRYHDVAMQFARAAFVSVTLTPAFFGQQISDVLLHGIPDFIATATTGIGGATSDSQFDIMRNQILDREAKLTSQLTSVIDIGPYITVKAVSGFAVLMVWCLWVLSAFAKTMLTVCVVCLPFALWSFLFRATSQFGANFIGQIGAYLIMGALLAILLAVSVKVDMDYMRNLPGTVSTDIGINSLWAVVLFTGFSVVCSAAVPGLASRLAGGAIAGWVGTGMMMATAGLSIAGGTGRVAWRMARR